LEVSRLPLGDGQELVYSPLTRTAHVLPAWGVRLLQGCRTFASLDEHARRLGQEGSLAPEQRAAVPGQLMALVQAGLLVPYSDLAALCRRRPPAPEAAPPLTTVGIPTRNRTASLQACLASYLANAQRFGTTPAFVVVDASDRPETRRANRQMLQAVQARSGAEVHYAGPEELAPFAEALIREGLPAEAVTFALLNPEGCPLITGASRNALLLHTVGEALLQVDDDTVCQLAPAPDRQVGLTCTSQYDPTEFWFVPDADGMVPGGADEEGNLLAIHGQLLGKSLGDCLAGLGDVHPHLDQAGTGFFRRLAEPEARVLVTAAGWAGDSGMGSSVYFLSADGPTRARLLRCERDYRQALTRHQVIRAVTRPTVSEGTFCMAVNLGLDNRRLLPPFLPVQRNQDGVFAAVLRGCFAGGFFGFLPWVLVHQSPAPRRRSPEDLWRDAVRVHSGQIIQALVTSFAPGPTKGDAIKTLTALGRSLAEWGTAPAGDFAELVRLLLWNALSRQAALLEGQLQRFGGQPDFWARDVRQVLALWREALPRPDFGQPADLADLVGTGDALAFGQRLVRRFGVLLQSWPDLVAVARDLRARGRRLAARLTGSAA
jgi:hypothetical protein